jgi:hypothetical protein
MLEINVRETGSDLIFQCARRCCELADDVDAAEELPKCICLLEGCVAESLPLNAFWFLGVLWKLGKKAAAFQQILDPP